MARFLSKSSTLSTSTSRTALAWLYGHTERTQRQRGNHTPSIRSVEVDCQELAEELVCSYLVLGITESYAECLHSSDHCLHGREDVLVHQLGVAPLVLVCVASSVDDPHLFDKGALSTLSSACWIH